MLRSWLLLLGQLVLLITWVMVSSMSLSFIFIAVQILLTIYVLYRMKKAIDYNYGLVQEKIHRAPRNITSSGDNGTKRVF